MFGFLWATSSLSTKFSTASDVVEAGSRPYSKDVVQITLLYSKGGMETWNWAVKSVL